MAANLLKIFISAITLFAISNESKANDTAKAQTLSKYENTLIQLAEILNNPIHSSFKNAVFITENTYLNGLLDSNAFNTKIATIASAIQLWIQLNPIGGYNFSDSTDFKMNLGIFKLMKESIAFVQPNSKDTFLTTPFLYDFESLSEKEDWTKMFVSKLFITYKGNCHSLPYLYKILADELGATCWLSLAPNHMYIRNRCKKSGWYNTELTSGEFPIDAWIATSGYVPVDAIRNGIYMDTLSNQQSIALCVLDLAKGYEFQTKNYHDGFIIKCCDLALQYHPLSVQAILLKAETLKHVYEKQKAAKDNQAETTYSQMEKFYIHLFDLGYREMPEKMYQQWLQSVTQQKGKYGNKQLKSLSKKQ
jgi:hypothetical protein